MLVLTRKSNEQILIGDDVKITVLRLKGNTVRIGIEAPRERKIIRGELELRSEQAPVETPEAAEMHEGGGPQISPREEAFAHPVAAKKSHPQRNRLDEASKPQVFVGTVRANGEDATLQRAPLADFVAAV